MTITRDVANVSAQPDPATRQKSVAVVTCSTREPRLNPYITSFVTGILQPVAESGKISLSHIDIESYALPLLNEAGIPAHHPKDDPTPHYKFAYSRAWSAEIRRHDAFVFVTPQYNWSFPASLKNALDYLYHEWVGKPAVIVTYGSRGGGKCAVQLTEVLLGLRMKPCSKTPALPYMQGLLERCLQMQQLDPAQVEKWVSEGKDRDIREAWEVLVSLLAAST